MMSASSASPSAFKRSGPSSFLHPPPVELTSPCPVISSAGHVPGVRPVIRTMTTPAPRASMTATVLPGSGPMSRRHASSIRLRSGRSRTAGSWSHGPVSWAIDAGSACASGKSVLLSPHPTATSIATTTLARSRSSTSSAARSRFAGSVMAEKGTAPAAGTGGGRGGEPYCGCLCGVVVREILGGGADLKAILIRNDMPLVVED